jgi:putative ABC transport system substrate-binding protein
MRLARLTLPAILALSLLTAPLSSETQQPGRVARIGSVSMAPGPHPTPHLRAAFLEGLRAHGWIEGQNIVIERRFAAGDPARLNQLAMELVRLPVDLITVTANNEAMAVRQASASIPIGAPRANEVIE